MHILNLYKQTTRAFFQQKVYCSAIFFNMISTRGNKAKRMVKNGLPAIHPGEFLAEIMGEMGISQAEFEHTIGVSPMRISHVIKGARTVTAELALLFGVPISHLTHFRFAPWVNSAFECSNEDYGKLHSS